MDPNFYIRTYDNVLDTNLCKNILELCRDTDFERWDREGRPQFSQFNVTEYAQDNLSSGWAKVHNRMIEAIKEVSNRYMEDVGCQENWPFENTLEQVRIKRYYASKGDRFDLHADVGNHDSARRFLALFFYLNDVEEGGETEFPDRDLKIKAEQGKCLLFPPTWTYPHAGLVPVSNDKYIIGTYLHYI